MSKFSTVWFWDSGRTLNTDHKHVMSFFDDSHTKPSVVVNEKSPHHAYCHSFNCLDTDGHIVVHLVGKDFVDTVPLWYVYADNPNTFPYMRTVLAFTDDRYSDGTVLTMNDAIDAGISPNESAGFVRWFVADSRIQQISVKEEHRRKRISVKLFSIADIMVISDIAWNGAFLNGGDITTNDGEKLRTAWQNSTRVTARIGSVETR